MTTFMQKKEAVRRQWYVIDAKGINLGRLASFVAHYLRGKHKVTFTPHIDGGDFIIVLNATKVNLTGDKLEQKMYYNHSGYPGGLRERKAKVMLAKYPIEMIERAVKGMLPKGRLGRKMAKKLFVYKDENHPHQAQQPIRLEMD